MQEATFAFPYAVERAVGSPSVRAKRLAVKATLVLLACYFATAVGFAHKIPPHNISPLWPVGAILFSVLVVSPVRHWWVYIPAAYFASVINDARAGFPAAAIWFIIAGLGEVLIAAVGVRRFAGGVRAFDSPRGFVAYLSIAVFLAPFLAAFLGAVPGGTESYWFYWRAWFLSEAIAFLLLAPAILTWMQNGRSILQEFSLAKWIELGVILCGLTAISVRIFEWPTSDMTHVPTLVYLPLPLLLWAAMRFGPTGVSSGLLVLACASISGTVNDRGPFAIDEPAESVFALQLFLAAVSVPVMLLAALIQEGRDKSKAFHESQLQLHEQRAELTHLSRVAVLGELTGALAHELNQPLTAILSNAQAAQRFLAQNPASLSEVHDILNDIATEDKRAGEVIRRLRALLKRGETQLQRLDINEVLDDVFALAHADCASRGVTVERDLASSLPAVSGDRIQLQQVMLNLMLNGCDALRDCEGRDRTLRIASSLDAQRDVQVSVADNGHGIPSDQIDRLFDAFFTTKEQGLGLGLTICRSIINAHGGKLWAENSAAGGAIFHLSLPASGGLN